MAPDGVELNDYEGDGDWFKIETIGASNGKQWDIGGYAVKGYSERQMNFTIPETTPPGKYLMRVEHLNISPFYKSTEMYVNCAHIEVSGPGGGMSINLFIEIEPLTDNV
jgi:hypothetical protein